MRKAFSTRFQSEDDVSEQGEEVNTDMDEIENSEIWADTAEEIASCTEVLPRATHLRCFAHSLQLVVNDALKEIKSLYGVLAKCSKIATLLHTSTKFKVCGCNIYVSFYFVNFTSQHSSIPCALNVL